MPKYEDVYPALNWRYAIEKKRSVTPEELVETLSLEGSPWDLIPKELDYSVTQFRRLSSADRIRAARRYLDELSKNPERPKVVLETRDNRGEEAMAEERPAPDTAPEPNEEQDYTIPVNLLACRLVDVSYQLEQLEKEANSLNTRVVDARKQKIQIEAAIRVLGVDPAQLMKDW